SSRMSGDGVAGQLPEVEAAGWAGQEGSSGLAAGNGSLVGAALIGAAGTAGKEPLEAGLAAGVEPAPAAGVAGREPPWGCAGREPLVSGSRRGDGTGWAPAPRMLITSEVCAGVCAGGWAEDCAGDCVVNATVRCSATSAADGAGRCCTGSTRSARPEAEAAAGAGFGDLAGRCGSGACTVAAFGSAAGRVRLGAGRAESVERSLDTGSCSRSAGLDDALRAATVPPAPKPPSSASLRMLAQNCSSSSSDRGLPHSSTPRLPRVPVW